MATVYQRNGGWHIHFRYQGRRYRELAGRNITKADAKQFLAKRMREVQKEDIYEKKPDLVPFATFADEYRVIDSPGKKWDDRDKAIVEIMKPQWKGLNLIDITTRMIETYMAKRMKVRMPATVSREIQVVKRMFKRAVEWKHLREDPAALVTLPRFKNQRVRFLEPEVLARLFGHLPEWLRKIATFARFTGARRGEIIGLPWTDVDFKRRTLTYRDTKNGETVTVPMNDTVYSLLRSLPVPIDRTTPVFQVPDRAALPTRSGGPGRRLARGRRSPTSISTTYGIRRRPTFGTWAWTWGTSWSSCGTSRWR